MKEYTLDNDNRAKKIHTGDGIHTVERALCLSRYMHNSVRVYVNLVHWLLGGNISVELIPARFVSFAYG